MPRGIAPKMVQLGRKASQKEGWEGLGRVYSPRGGQVVGAGAAFGRGGQGSGLCLAFETIKAQIGGSKGIGRWRAALRAGARWGAFFVLSSPSCLGHITADRRKWRGHLRATRNG